MSIEAMTLVLNHSKAAGRAKLVLIGIANHQGDQGAWPSIQTLARYANSSERSVMRDIQELEALGELIVQRNAAPIRGQYRPNLYWVNIDSGVTNPPSGVTDSSSGVTDEVVRGDSVVTLNVINPKEKPKETYPQAELEDAFSEFWQVYPRKVEKIDARKAFEKAVQSAPVREVLEGARRLAEDPNRPPKQFVPYPASWLRAGGWTNEPYPERTLTPEEVAERQRALAEKRREADRRASEQMRAERERAEAEAVPAPTCIHGNNLVFCLPCIRALNVGKDN